MQKRFFAHVLPAMLAFLFSGLYTIVDGFFVGQNMGDVGLAANSIAYPLAAVILAVGTGIGMGAAVQIAICHGKGDRVRERKLLGNALVLLTVAALVLTTVLTGLSQPVLILFGAKGEVLTAGLRYIRVIGLGAIFQVFATGLTPLIRNYGGNFTAMAAMIAGFITNIILDALFVSVWGMGMAGAALATIIGQGVTTVPCLICLMPSVRKLQKSDFHPGLEAILPILRVGASPFGLALSPQVVMVLMNRSAVGIGGQTAVAAYSIIAYVVAIFQMLMQGVGDGCQPLVSLSIGQGELGQAHKVRRWAFLFSALVAMVVGTGTLLCSDVIPAFFGASRQAGPLVKSALPLFVAGFLFVAFCRVATSYFYATRRNTASYLLIYGEVALLAVNLLWLPPLFSLMGVWLAIPITQGMLAVIGAILLRQEKTMQPERAIVPD